MGLQFTPLVQGQPQRIVKIKYQVGCGASVYATGSGATSEDCKIKYQVGCGASVYATGAGATSEDCKNVETLFSKVGKCWR